MDFEPTIITLDSRHKNHIKPVYLELRESTHLQILYHVASLTLVLYCFQYGYKSARKVVIEVQSKPLQVVFNSNESTFDNQRYFHFHPV